MLKLRALLQRYVSALHTPTFDAKVASNVKTFSENKTLSQRVWWRFKRDLALSLTGQFLFQRSVIPPEAKRVLYVYLGMPQLGDSIMDLSARTLWAKRGIGVDLFTHPSLASLYENDPSFNRIFSEAKNLAPSYDFVVLQSFTWKCLKVKWRYFLMTPFLALHGYYYGPEFNRFDFACQVWASVLGITGNHGEVKPVFNLKLDHQPKPRQPETIALALGGVVQWRTYTRWVELLALMQHKNPQFRWVLLGSENGLSAASQVMEYFEMTNQTYRVKNYVGQLSLAEVFEQLQRVALLVTADGGLLHLAKAAQTPVVALLAGPIHPMMRFKESDTAWVIHAPFAVDEIKANQVAEDVFSAMRTNVKSIVVSYVGQEPVCG